MRDDVTSANFVKKMHDSMREQQVRGEQAARKPFHDAKVAETAGPQRWLALKTLVAQSASEINRGFESVAGLAYSEGGLDSFTLLNRAADRFVQASFDATNAVISCHGEASGSFLPHVEGNELTYSWQNATPASAVAANVGFIGDVVTVEQMSEILISSVISP
jgi:hypothetical protein